MEREEKIKAIIEAAKNNNFSDEIDNIELIEYYYTDIYGEVSTWEDVFDHIDIDSDVVCVKVICGTGYENLCVPIEDLTDYGVNKLYNCINK